MTQKRRWTDQDFGFVADHPEWSARQIGESLGRTKQSVQHIRNKLRDGWAPIMEAWTEAEIEFVRSTPNLTAEQVAKHLGRGVAAIKDRRRFLIANEGLSFRTNKDPRSVGTRRLVAKTCVSCGLLLAGKWYRLAQRGDGPGMVWTSKCSRCAHSGDKERTDEQKHKVVSNKREWVKAHGFEAKAQGLSKPHAHRHGMPWLEADHAVLADPDLTYLEKAIALGRTYKAVLTRCSAEGYPSKIGLGDPVKGQWLIDNPNADKMAG